MLLADPSLPRGCGCETKSRYKLPHWSLPHALSGAQCVSVCVSVNREYITVWYKALFDRLSSILGFALLQDKWSILILNVDWLISFLWSPFQSGSTQRSYRRVRVLSVCELSSKAQRAAIQPAVTDFTLGFMLSLVGKRMERKARKRVKLSWITTTFTNFVTGRTAVTFVRLKTKWQLLV